MTGIEVACPFCLSRPKRPCRDSRGRYQKHIHVIRRETARREEDT